MKDLSSHNRFVQMYHPYYQAPPSPTYSYKAYDSYSDTHHSTMNFANGGLYESEEEETFPGSPFSNTDDAFADDLNAIDFSDLFNYQKHEQDEAIQSRQLMELILNQVRSESLASLDSLDTNYSLDRSPARTPECGYLSIKEEVPNTYTQLQPAISPLCSHLPQQAVATPSTPVSNAYEFNANKIETEKQRRRCSSDDNNEKIRLYEFVLQLLNEERAECIRWLCPIEGEFEITNSAKIAQLWGNVKKNPTMTYEKFARALRHYYKLGILINYKHKEKLRYKFSQDILLKNKKSLEVLDS